MFCTEARKEYSLSGDNEDPQKRFGVLCVIDFVEQIEELFTLILYNRELQAEIAAEIYKNSDPTDDELIHFENHYCL